MDFTEWKAAYIILPEIIPLSFNSCTYKEIILLYISNQNEVQTNPNATRKFHCEERDG